MKRTLLSLCFFASLTAHSQNYENGNLSTGSLSKSNTSAPENYTWSELQNDDENKLESNSMSGVGVTKSEKDAYFIADDFTIPDGQSWQISTIDFFAYQTGNSEKISPFKEVLVSILKKDPSSNEFSTVFGNDKENLFVSGTDAMMYRIFNSTVPTTDNVPDLSRKIWKTTAAVPAKLSAGTFWIKYQLNTDKYESGFSPTVTIPGQRGLKTFNAMQYNVKTKNWIDLMDDGTPLEAPDFAIDIPFVITYKNLTANSEIRQYDNRVQVYPKPVEEQFKITGIDDLKVTGIDILDGLGKVVRSLKDAEEYNVSDLPAGNYYLLIKSDQLAKLTKFTKK